MRADDRRLDRSQHVHGLPVPSRRRAQPPGVRGHVQARRSEGLGEVSGRESRRGYPVLMSAIARWDAFLATIQARHRDVLAAAEVAARNFIGTVAAGGDV